MNNFDAIAHKELAEAHRVIFTLNNEISEFERLIAEKRHLIAVQEQRIHMIEESLYNRTVTSQVQSAPNVDPSPVTQPTQVTSSYPGTYYAQPVKQVPTLQYAPVQSSSNNGSDISLNRDIQKTLRTLYGRNKTDAVQQILRRYNASDITTLPLDVAQALKNELDGLLKVS